MNLVFSLEILMSHDIFLNVRFARMGGPRPPLNSTKYMISARPPPRPIIVTKVAPRLFINFEFLIAIRTSCWFFSWKACCSSSLFID